MIVAYLMVYEDLKYSEALKQVRDKRPIATPNFGFEKHLIWLEISAAALKKEIEEELKVVPFEEEKKME